MSRPTLRILSALLVLAASACASPTAPARTRQLAAPAAGASFDDVVPIDTTCKSDYIVGQGKTC